MRPNFVFSNRKLYRSYLHIKARSFFIKHQRTTYLLCTCLLIALSLVLMLLVSSSDLPAGLIISEGNTVPEPACKTLAFSQDNRSLNFTICNDIITNLK
ncbi:MAG: hypothetical protein V1837_02755 [Candidatus Woesearchaeota archaeon]